MASATQIETSPAVSDHSEKHLWHKGQSLDDEVRSFYEFQDNFPN